MHNLAPLEPGTRALVLGLGRTGLSSARYLDRKGLEVRVADTRDAPPGLAALREQVPRADIRTGVFESALLDGVAQVVISPGLSLREPVATEALSRGLPVVGDIELFAREAQAPVAAITGTNGKSTVTSLLAEIANAAHRPAIAGGNLGEPALDLLERPVPALYVLELSSFQLETTHSLETQTATVLNVTPDHMDRYGSVAEYAAAKARIFDGCAVAVINADDPLVRAMPRAGQRVISFSLQDAGADYSLVDVPEPALCCRGEALLPVSAMRLQGTHNVANALAALAMCEALGLPRGAGARSARRVRRARAPDAVGRRRRWRPLRQRLEGNQRRRDARGGVRPGRSAGAHRRRRRQGPGLRAAARRRSAARCGTSC